MSIRRLAAVGVPHWAIIAAMLAAIGLAVWDPAPHIEKYF